MKILLATAGLLLLMVSLCQCSPAPTCQELRTCESPTTDGARDSPNPFDGDAAKGNELPDTTKDAAPSDSSASETSVDATGEMGLVDETSRSDAFSQDATADDERSSNAVDGRGPSMFGTGCVTDDDCKTIGATFFCLKSFDIFRIPQGICTRPCQGGSLTDCTEIAGACITERMGSNDASATARTACFPTCKVDVPCRTGFKCNFVYRNGMLVEPSVCVPEVNDAGGATGDP